MKRMFEKYPDSTRRAFEILIPLISWLLITLPFWLSFWHPAWVAYFVIAFDVYWFYKSLTLAINGTRAFLTISAHTKVDWLKELEKLPHWQKLYHVIIIPEYKEPQSVLDDTLENLTKQQFPLKNIIVVLATEATDSQRSITTNYLVGKYKNIFKYLWVTEHPVIAGEIRGKSSNMAWAGRETVAKLTQHGLDIND